MEDEYLIALALAEAVEDLDGKVVGPVATVAAALEIMNTRAIAAALLDARLADRDVTPVAVRLAEEGIPFVIHTATGLPEELASSLSHLPVVLKPLKAAIVAACLLNEIRDPGQQQLLR